MILVTGAGGFVGRRVADRLAARGMKVRCLGRHRPAGGGASGNVEWVLGDIAEPGSLRQAMQGVTTVIHLVGIIVPVGRNTFERVHAQGTRNVVEAAKQAGVQRIVHMSALGTHANARSMYHQTKWRGEVYVRYGGIPHVIFRPSIIFGPGDAFLNMFAGMTRWMPALPLVGGGRNRLQPIWVEDVAECFVRAAQPGPWDNKVYELGGTRAYAMKELMQALMRVLGRRRLLIPVPVWAMRLQAILMEWAMPKPPLTRDQLLMMEEENVCDAGAAQKDFEIQFSDLIPKLQEYLRT